MYKTYSYFRITNIVKLIFEFLARLVEYFKGYKMMNEQEKYFDE